MWLGMLAAAAGQVPGLPVEALNAVNALLLAYIAQVAAWCGRPSWAYLHVRFGLGGLFVSYLAIATAAALVQCWRRHRRRKAADGPKSRVRLHFSARRQGQGLVLAAGLVVLGLGWALLAPGGGVALSPPAGLRVSVLDVGQGDAILLQPRRAPAVLVDGGPPGDSLAAKLRAAGIERLGAAIVTHDQSDHAGGIRELLGAMPIDRLLYAELHRSTLAEVRAAGASPRRLARGDELRSGQLHLEVLWPPAELLAGSWRGEDPNRLAIVMVARWRHFSMLLTADAEAEATPLDPGPVDVLKVAHHGSEDAGLAALLGRAQPRLALISVGADNPFGHPTNLTLGTLATHGVRTLRTDGDGTVVLDIERDAIRVSSER